MKNVFVAALLIAASLIAASSVGAQMPPKISLFRLQEVQLLPGIFKDAENTDLKYMMALDPDRLLAPFLREAGLPPKAESYGNWENSGLDGHIGGHYLSALSLMYASTGDNKVLERLNYLLGELKKCQDKNGDGYLGGVPGSRALWAEIFKGNVGVIKQKWVPLYNIHKAFAGLRDAYLYTGNLVAKEMLLKFSDWFVRLANSLTEQQMQDMLQTEHGGPNEVLADVAALTGDKKYLDAACKFSHKAILEPLEHKEDKLTHLHANTQIPKVIGFERIAQVGGDRSYSQAASFFWETVVGHRTCAIGGNSVREHFHPADDFSSMMTSEQGPETCNTYNMLKLTRMLYQTDGSGKYIDYYERALYNHILSTQHPGTGGFVYFTPMRPGHYRVYSQPQTSFWCCVGSGMENHAKYGELIYAHDENDLFVNLFIPSRLNWKEKGLVLEQQTLFPDEEKTSLVIEAVKKPDFTLRIRYPVWVQPGKLTISVNGHPIGGVEAQGGMTQGVVGQAGMVQGGYVVLKRIWKKGDKIVVTLPMQTTTERLPDGSDYVAVLHGPIVLAAKTDSTGLTGLFADDSRMGHVANGQQYPLQDMPVFVSDSTNIASLIHAEPNKTLTFTASDLIYPSTYKNLELIPFFRLHDSRYVIYWQTVTPGKLAETQQKTANQEAEKQKLAESTVDVVIAGEQQPESDHFIESENSTTGVTKDRHWRDAKGWFSYRMTDKEKQAGRLRVTYSGGDKNRRFNILVNEQLIATVDPDSIHGSVPDDISGNDLYSVDYLIPEKVLQQANGILRVTFSATAGFATGSVYEVRLLKGGGQVFKPAPTGKPISPDLFGIFFEDLNYAADGGLYAELVQNRSFEYTNAEVNNWNALTSWELVARGGGKGTIAVDSADPLHFNNPHYAVLNVESGGAGVGLMNSGFDGIVLKAGEKYNLSLFARQTAGQAAPLVVVLESKIGIVYGKATLSKLTKNWANYTATISSGNTDDSARLLVFTTGAGVFHLDMISLFPQATFHNRSNGLRADLAQVIAGLHPKFMRFPGGCLAHGNGLGNMYRWKNTIGPVEQRKEQSNIWRYNQTAGLGYFEYFQFCEDIGAKPLPVIPAGVCCQNSGHSNGTGQRGLPMDQMPDYVQEVLDLIEYANGPVESTWGARRAAAGHPLPFHLEYLGVGNEDAQTPVFRERWKMVFDAIHAKHPEITVIGTVGPSPSGPDYEEGWKFAHEQRIPFVDEHYYLEPDQFLAMQDRYDSYDRTKSKIYLGEYAARDIDQKNTLRSALAEAAYMTSLERNGDVVRLASYAPLLAREGHTQWTPDLIYFTGTGVCPTVNYYVQQLFSTNQGDLYYSNIITPASDVVSASDAAKKTFATSCVKDSKTGDLILKLVNAGPVAIQVRGDLSGLGRIHPKATCTVLTGAPLAEDTFTNPRNVVPETSDFVAGKSFAYEVPPYSLIVIRIKTN
ncbi:MAG TPA: beta-L-arabinofuranosidase domain-containing protein [Puia sp.]|nr:beta-L-arabinofuranosidase domain-containing protein [Puia sp.]